METNQMFLLVIERTISFPLKTAFRSNYKEWQGVGQIALTLVINSDVWLSCAYAIHLSWLARVYFNDEIGKCQDLWE